MRVPLFYVPRASVSEKAHLLFLGMTSIEQHAGCLPRVNNSKFLSFKNRSVFDTTESKVAGGSKVYTSGIPPRCLRLRPATNLLLEKG